MEHNSPTPQFEIVTTRMGVVSIRDNVTQEIMHNPVGPWVEANSLYIQQSHLARRLSEISAEELVIFDVGLGAAANALAALHCARALKTRRPLRLVSFERNLDLLQFALDNAGQFEHFAGFETAVESILSSGQWQESEIVWELRHGDFREWIERESNFAHVIFYDPYSFKKNQDMWSTEIFSQVRKKSAADGMLLTYSRATPIRVSLLMAGFYVGSGISTGAKDETTQACVRYEDLENPLGAAWLGRWHRSHNPNAAGASAESLGAVKEFIQGHSQFRVR
jgi:tRNA U34 5-methylaminomethyl-2-thiouridine-forming methyltransferase MnmC